jgi:hypothetical protein
MRGVGIGNLLRETGDHVSCGPRRQDQLLGRRGPDDQVDPVKLSMYVLLSHSVDIHLCFYSLSLSFWRIILSSFSLSIRFLYIHHR